MGASTLIAVLGVSCLVAVTMAAPSECDGYDCDYGKRTVQKKTEIVEHCGPNDKDSCYESGSNGYGHHGGKGEYGKVEKETKTVTNFQEPCGSNGYGHHGGIGDCGQPNVYESTNIYQYAPPTQSCGGDYQMPQTGPYAQDLSCGGSKCSDQNGGNKLVGLDFLNSFG